MWIVQFQYEIYLPVYLCICSFCVDNFQSTPRPNRRIAEWPWNSLWTHWCPHPYLTAAWDAAENSTVIHDQKGQKRVPTSHNLTKWFFFCISGRYEGIKVSKRHSPQPLQSNPASIHKWDDKALPFSPPMKASYMSLRKRSKNSSPAAQTANREACKWIKDWRMISSVKVRKLTGRIIQEQVTDPNKVCA